MKPGIDKRCSYFYCSLASTCSVLLIPIALCAGQSGVAQRRASTQPISAAVASTSSRNLTLAQAAKEEKDAATPSKEGSNGIKVHGHWKFVVHDPDGTLVSTREFENSLITPAAGDFLIASALLGQSVPSDWAVLLCPVAGNTWAAPPYTSGRMLAGTFCPGTNNPVAVLVPSFSTIAGSIFAYSNFCNSTTNDPNPTGNTGNLCVTGLTQALTGGTTSSPGYSITLSGSFTAITGVTINSVGTYTGYCPPPAPGEFSTTGAAACEVTVAPRFSQTSTSPSMLVFTGTNQTQILAAGQILTVTVTISFS